MKESREAICYTLDSPEILGLCASDERLALLIHRCGKIQYDLHTEPFSFFIETIIGQMLSSKAADAITARLYDICGGELTPTTILSLNLPTLKSIGLSGQKAEYVLSMATLVRDVPNFFDELTCLPDGEVIKRLTGLRGIGMWSAKMYLIFVINQLDVLPFEDGAFLQAYRWLYDTDDVKPASIVQRCEIWKPYSSLAARYLYRAVDDGLIKESIQNFLVSNRRIFYEDAVAKT